MENRISKGIWIPIEIWEDEALTWNEKILFMEIDSFTSKKKECFISNEHIAKLLKVTETTANKVLSSLIKKGYVIKTNFDGRHRFVKTALTFSIEQGCSNEQGRVAPKSNILYNNNNIINKEYKDKSLYKKEEDKYNDCSIVFDTWNKMVESVSGLPKVTKITEKRKKKVLSLIKNCDSSIEELVKFINTIPYADDWVIGKAKNSSWSITFDWLIANTSNWYVNGLEGNMHKNKHNKFVSMMLDANDINKNKSPEPSEDNITIGNIEYR